MTFSSVELQNDDGQNLPTDGNGTSYCRYNQQFISELIHYRAFVDDANQPQDVKLIVSIKDKEFYEFVEEPNIRRTHYFNSANGRPFSFSFRLRRLVNQGPMINCTIRGTLVFTNGNGQEMREPIPCTIKFKQY